MSKTVIYELKKTLKAGSDVYPQGSTFNDDTLPEKLKYEIEHNTGNIEVKTYGDFEDSEFDPAKTVVNSRKKKLGEKILKPRKKLGV